MSDLGNVGFTSDTSGLVALQTELDRLKAKVDSLNSSLKNMDPASSEAKAKLADLKTATSDYQTALGNVVDKQLAAGKAGQALDTIVAHTGVTYAQANQALRDVVAAHTAAEGAIGKTAAALTGVGSAAASSGAEASKSTGFWASLATALGLSTGNVNQTAVAHKGLATAVHGGASDMTEFREIVHSVGPALEQMGLQLSQVTQFSYAARGGLGLLAAAIAGGVAVAVAKASDDVALAKQRLEGLAGVKMGGEFADQLQRISTELGISRTAAAPAAEALAKIANLNTPPNGVRILSPDTPTLLTASAASAQNLATSYAAIFEQLRLGGATTAAATTATNKFFADLATNGKVTSQMVSDLAKVAPQAATSLANAFTQGKLNVDQFVEALKKTPIPIQQLLDLLPKLETGGASTFHSLQQQPVTVMDAVDRLKKNFEDLFLTIDGGTKDRPGAIAQFIGQVAEDIVSLDTAVKNARAGTDDWNARLGALFGTIGIIAGGFRQVGTDIADFVKGITGSDQPLSQSANLFETLGHAVGVASSAIGSFVSIIGGGLASGLGSIGNFVMASIQNLTDWANQAIALARSVASAIAGAAAAAPGPQSGPADSSAGSASFGGMGPEMFGQVAPASSGGVDTGSGGFDSGGLEGFATGGSFVVGGSGGTDSQLIQFMATPGEQVSINPPGSVAAAAAGGAAQTLGALLPANDNGGTAGPSTDIVSAHIAEDFKTQTAALSDRLGSLKDAVVNAVNGLATSFKATVATTSIATAATAAGTTGSPSSSTTSSVGTAAASSAAGSGQVSFGGIQPGSLAIKGQPAPARAGSNPYNGPAPAPGASPKDASGNDLYINGVPNPSPGLLFEGRGMSTSDAMTSLASYQKNLASSLDSSQAQLLSSLQGGPSAVAAAKPSSGTAAAATPPGTGIGPDGLIHPPFSGTLDERGLPPAGTVGSPYQGPIPDTGLPGSRFAGPVAPKADTEAVKNQTDALKQSQAETSKTIAEAVNSQTDDSKTIGEKTNSSLDSVESSTKDSLNSLNSVNQATEAGNQATASGFEETNSSLGQTTDAVSSGSSSIVDSVGSAASSISQAVASAVSASGGGVSAGGSVGSVGSGGSTFGGNDFGSSGGGSSSSGGTASNGGGNSSAGGDSGGGFTPSDAFFAQGMGLGSGGVDTGSVGFDSGGVQGFAVGGQFTVKGSGTTDTEKVQFWATPGETVTVTPPGGTPPPNPSMGSAPSNKSGAMAFATGGQFSVGDAVSDPFHDTLTLGGAMGAPSLAGADVIAAHLADNTRDQTASLKDKLDQVAAKVVDAINAGANAIRNAVTSALAQIAADARAVANAGAQGAGGLGVGTAVGGLATGQRVTQQSQLGPGYYIDPTTGMPKQLVSYTNNVDQAGFSNPFTGGMNTSLVGPNGFGISPFAGMAEGGTFVVPGGSGDSDSVTVGIKAAPGERIMVLPPEEAKALEDLKNTIRITPQPLAKFMPALSPTDSIATAAASSNVPTPWHDTLAFNDNIPGSGAVAAMAHHPSYGGTAPVPASSIANAKFSDRPVTIYVQPGVQADTFIRSRAQIQRAMRG